MRLLFFRHGDPDYVNDSLTPQGHIEAQALAEFAPDYWNFDEAFVSPLGRAKKTAQYTLDAMNMNAITYDWLKEFDARVDLNTHPEWLSAFPDAQKTVDGTSYVPRICWDVVPSYLQKNPIYYNSPDWRNGELCTKSDILIKYDEVCNSFDALLARYGYVRDGSCYHVTKESTLTLGFFCHFGVTCVIMSHLMNISPFTLWNGLCLAPTSVTEIVTEEREQGVAQFRTLRSGDITHLTRKNIEPSFAARFAEVYSDKEHRH